MSRSLLTFALLGWALLLADVGPVVGAADGLAPDTQSTVLDAPGDEPADDPPDTLVPAAGTPLPDLGSRPHPLPSLRTTFDRRLESDHPARAPPGSRST